MGPKLELKKWRENGFIAQTLQFAKLGFEVFVVRGYVFCILGFQSVLASVFVDSNSCALVLSSMFYERKLNSVPETISVFWRTFLEHDWIFRNSLPKFGKD